ncbi:MAG: hypothetical protein HOA05_09900 [Candidatus Marinimicrobia bacterium]|nr:hypothetical protein [Candidatus Neomarinimicrobiota bacterium]
MCTETKFVGQNEYRSSDSTWYRYKNDVKGNQVEPFRMILRKSNGTKVTGSDLSALSITNAEIQSDTLIGAFNIVTIDTTENPFIYAQRADTSSVACQSLPE